MKPEAETLAVDPPWYRSRHDLPWDVRVVDFMAASKQVDAFALSHRAPGFAQVAVSSGRCAPSGDRWAQIAKVRKVRPFGVCHLLKGGQCRGAGTRTCGVVTC